MQWSATCCWPTSEPASARARNERAPRRLYHISMAKSSIFFTQTTEKLLDFPPTLITDSKLKITCKVHKVRATHAISCTKCKVQSAKCKVQSAKCKVQSAKCKARAHHALLLALELTHTVQLAILLTWLGYTNHSKKAT